MANTIQTSSEYKSATQILHSVLFPTQIDKSSNKPTTLAERIDAIPTKTRLLVERNTRDGLGKLLDKELGHYVTLRKTEELVVNKMATFLVASSADIRNKLVIANTPLSTQISTINALLEKARGYLNNTAFELARMNNQVGLFESWLPDPKCSYFESALAKLMQTQVQPNITTAEQTQSITDTPSTDSLSQDPEPTTTQNSNNAQNQPVALEETPQAGDNQVVASASVSQDPEPATTQNSNNAQNQPVALEETPQAGDNQEVASASLSQEPEPTTTPNSNNAQNQPVALEEAPQAVDNQEVAPASLTQNPEPTTTPNSNNAQNQPVALEEAPQIAGQQVNPLLLPKIASSPQIATQSTEATNVAKPAANQTSNPGRAKSQEPPPLPNKERLKAKDENTTEPQEQKKNPTGSSDQAIRRRTSTTAGKKEVT